jgi:hypothetical protein
MGRKKIKIQKIINERNRKATEQKRVNGLVKKAIEASILSGCDILLLVHSPESSNIVTYASSDMVSVLSKYQKATQDASYTEQTYSNRNLDVFSKE